MSKAKKLRKSIKYSLLIGLVKIVLAIVKITPWKFTSYLCEKLGILAFYLVKKERIKTINNLTIAYGNEKNPDEINQMAKEVFANLGRAAAELAIKIADNASAY